MSQQPLFPDTLEEIPQVSNAGVLDVPGPGGPALATALSEPLGSRMAPGVAEEPVADPKTCRLLHPCNREDALRLLAGLCISKDFPDPHVFVSVMGGRPALLNDGLRRSEADLLSRGLPQRFPILIEVRGSAGTGGFDLVAWSNVKGLVFRTKEDLDEFRFRPVDEFDGESLPCTEEPHLFDLEGQPRFELQASAGSRLPGPGWIADRLGAGVLNVLSIGDISAACRNAAVEFLIGPRSQGDEASLATAVGHLLGERTRDERTRQAQAVFRAFLSFDVGSQRQLLDSIWEGLCRFPSGEAKTVKGEEVWLGTAQGILKNQIGIHEIPLSDEGHLILRSALLASMAKDVNALAGFLDTAPAPGPRVAVLAAFLLGLKCGITNMPWRAKSQRLEISDFVAGLLRELVEKPTLSHELIKIETRMGTRNDESILRSKWGQELARWETQPAEERLNLGARRQMFEGCGCRVIGPGDKPEAVLLKLPGGCLLHLEPARDEGFEYSTLRFRPGRGEKLRPARDLNELCRQPGQVWHPLEDSLGKHLYHDLIGGLDPEVLAYLERKLAALVIKGKALAKNGGKLPHMQDGALTASSDGQSRRRPGRPRSKPKAEDPPTLGLHTASHSTPGP